MKTQKAQVLDYLKKRKKGVTSLYAFEHWGITRLSDIIYKLRAEGHPIKTHPETTKNRYGNTVNYARYILQKEGTI